MPTSSHLKIDSGKKNVRIKWQNRTWNPRVVIRSMSSRVAGKWAPGLVSRYAQPPNVRRLSACRLDRAGLRPLDDGFSKTSLAFALARIRSFTTSRFNISL